MNNPKHRLVVAAVFFAFISSLTLLADIPNTQRQALIALYNSTNGDSWTNNAGWKLAPLHTDGFAMPGTENTWNGVIVDAENLNVTWINLSSNNLIGSIPAALGDLTGLQYLYLMNGQLSGSIPVELGDLTGLLGLYLATNELSGSIPADQRRHGRASRQSRD